MSVVFTDYSVEVKALLDQKARIFLEEAKASIASQASLNSPTATLEKSGYSGGALVQSFQTDSVVDGNTAYIGSSLEYAIYQEFGTGEYAVNGDGRQGGWTYMGVDGQFHHTKGNQPRRMLYRAFQQKRSAVIRRAEQIFGEI